MCCEDCFPMEKFQKSQQNGIEKQRANLKVSQTQRKPHTEQENKGAKLLRQHTQDTHTGQRTVGVASLAISRGNQPAMQTLVWWRPAGDPAGPQNFPKSHFLKVSACARLMQQPPAGSARRPSVVLTYSAVSSVAH